MKLEDIGKKEHSTAFRWFMFVYMIKFWTIPWLTDHCLLHCFGKVMKLARNGFIENFGRSIMFICVVMAMESQAEAIGQLTSDDLEGKVEF